MDMGRYLHLFAAEARDHVGAAYDLVSRFDRDMHEEGVVRELFRHVHSVKGMAASMGFAAITTLAHDAESLMDGVRAGAMEPTPEVRRVLCATLACLERMIDAAETGAPAEDRERPALQEALRRVLSADPASSSEPVAADPGGSASPSPAPAGGSAGAAGCVQAALIIRRDRAFPAIGAAIVVGKIARLGRIVRTEPPMAALRTGRFDGRLLVRFVSQTTLAALGKTLAAIDEVETFTLVPAELPPARAARKGPMSTLRVGADRVDALFEDAVDLMTTLGRLEARLDDEGAGAPARRDAAEGRALARRLYDRIVEVRLVPFQLATQRLERTAAELARTLAKNVRFEVEGQDVRIDRGLLEGMMDPLLHMVRNAIDHGIEAPAARHAARKAEAGRVTVRLEREGSLYRLTVEDDGAGLDPRRLRQTAIERGVLTPGEAARLADPDALALVTLPGFSTADSASEVSGRGVGMDVVKSAVEAMGGRLKIHATPGRSSRFELLVPCGVSLLQAFLVRSEDGVLAIPVASIARIAVLDDATTAFRAGRVHWSSGPEEAPVQTLPELLSPGRAVAEDARGTVLLFEGRGGGLTGLAVPGIEGRREIVVRPLPGPLATVTGYSGCALLDDGTIALVLDPGALGV